MHLGFFPNLHQGWVACWAAHIQCCATDRKVLLGLGATDGACTVSTLTAWLLCRLSYKGLGEPLCFLAFGPLATSAFYVAQVRSHLICHQ